jgi:hypothetical protein
LLIKNGSRYIEKFNDALVLQFQSKNLKKRWQYFIDTGCSWSYPSYKSHITVTYMSENINYKKIKPYTKDLLFGPEIFSEIDNNENDFKEIKL